MKSVFTRGLAMMAACAVMAITGCAELQQNIKEAPDTISANMKEMRETDREAYAETKERQAARTDEAPKTEPKKEVKEPEATEAPTTPVLVLIDGKKNAAADPYGIYWQTDGKVSAEPTTTITIDKSMGDFQFLIVNVYEADAEGKETNVVWSLNDFNSERAMMPGKTFSLAGGNGIMVVGPGNAIIQKVPYESGKTYVALFSVSATANNHTHKVRFTIE